MEKHKLMMTHLDDYVMSAKRPRPVRILWDFFFLFLGYELELNY